MESDPPDVGIDPIFSEVAREDGILRALFMNGFSVDKSIDRYVETEKPSPRDLLTTVKEFGLESAVSRARVVQLCVPKSEKEESTQSSAYSAGYTFEVKEYTPSPLVVARPATDALFDESTDRHSYGLNRSRPEATIAIEFKLTEPASAVTKLVRNPSAKLSKYIRKIEDNFPSADEVFVLETPDIDTKIEKVKEQKIKLENMSRAKDFGDDLGFEIQNSIITAKAIIDLLETNSSFLKALIETRRKVQEYSECFSSGLDLRNALSLLRQQLYASVSIHITTKICPRISVVNEQKLADALEGSKFSEYTKKALLGMQDWVESIKSKVFKFIAIEHYTSVIKNDYCCFSEAFEIVVKNLSSSDVNAAEYVASEFIRNAILHLQQYGINPQSVVFETPSKKLGEKWAYWFCTDAFATFKAIVKLNDKVKLLKKFSTDNRVTGSVTVAAFQLLTYTPSQKFKQASQDLQKSADLLLGRTKEVGAANNALEELSNFKRHAIEHGSSTLGFLFLDETLELYEEFLSYASNAAKLIRSLKEVDRKTALYMGSRSTPKITLSAIRFAKIKNGSDSVIVLSGMCYQLASKIGHFNIVEKEEKESEHENSMLSAVSTRNMSHEESLDVSIQLGNALCKQLGAITETTNCIWFPVVKSLVNIKPTARELKTICVIFDKTKKCACGKNDLHSMLKYALKNLLSGLTNAGEDILDDSLDISLVEGGEAPSAHSGSSLSSSVLQSPLSPSPVPFIMPVDETPTPQPQMEPTSLDLFQLRSFLGRFEPPNEGKEKTKDLISLVESKCMGAFSDSRQIDYVNSIFSTKKNLKEIHENINEKLKGLLPFISDDTVITDEENTKLNITTLAEIIRVLNTAVHREHLNQRGMMEQEIQNKIKELDTFLGANLETEQINEMGSRAGKTLGAGAGAGMVTGDEVTNQVSFTPQRGAAASRVFSKFKALAASTVKVIYDTVSKFKPQEKQVDKDLYNYLAKYLKYKDANLCEPLEIITSCSESLRALIEEKKEIESEIKTNDEIVIMNMKSYVTITAEIKNLETFWNETRLKLDRISLSVLENLRQIETVLNTILIGIEVPSNSIFEKISNIDSELRNIISLPIKGTQAWIFLTLFKKVKENKPKEITRIQENVFACETIDGRIRILENLIKRDGGGARLPAPELAPALAPAPAPALALAPVSAPAPALALAPVSAPAPVSTSQPEPASAPESASASASQPEPAPAPAPAPASAPAPAPAPASAPKPAPAPAPALAPAPASAPESASASASQPEPAPAPAPAPASEPEPAPALALAPEPEPEPAPAPAPAPTSVKPNEPAPAPAPAPTSVKPNEPAPAPAPETTPLKPQGGGDGDGGGSASRRGRESERRSGGGGVGAAAGAGAGAGGEASEGPDSTPSKALNPNAFKQKDFDEVAKKIFDAFILSLTIGQICTLVFNKREIDYLRLAAENTGDDGFLKALKSILSALRSKMSEFQELFIGTLNIEIAPLMGKIRDASIDAGVKDQISSLLVVLDRKEETNLVVLAYVCILAVLYTHKEMDPSQILTQTSIQSILELMHKDGTSTKLTLSDVGKHLSVDRCISLILDQRGKIETPEMIVETGKIFHKIIDIAKTTTKETVNYPTSFKNEITFNRTSDMSGFLTSTRHKLDIETKAISTSGSVLANIIRQKRGSAPFASVFLSCLKASGISIESRTNPWFQEYITAALGSDITVFMLSKE